MITPNSSWTKTSRRRETPAELGARKKEEAAKAEKKKLKKEHEKSLRTKKKLEREQKAQRRKEHEERQAAVATRKREKQIAQREFMKLSNGGEKGRKAIEERMSKIEVVRTKGKLDP